MIPTISPPTDNLYKLISLFGLGIFILGVVNFSNQSDEILKSKIKIEYLEKQIVDTIYYYNRLSGKKEELAFINTSEYETISDLMAELCKDEAAAHNRNIPPEVINYIDTEIDVVKVRLLAISKKETLNVLLISFSVVLMIFGFILWYLKEQRWQDKKARINAEKL